MKQKDIDRFWKHVKKGPECWVWTSTKRGGYGIFNLEGRTVSAHRLSYEMAYEKPTKFVRHTCDNPACVRPEHLLDMKNKGGLSKDQVILARELAATGKNIHELAQELKVNLDCLVSAIRGNDTPVVEHLNLQKIRKVRKLSHEQVREILKELENPWWGQNKYLMQKYNVSNTMISLLKTGKFQPAHFI